MAPGGQRLAASVSGVSLAVLGGKVRGEQEEEVTLVTRDEEGAGRPDSEEHRIGVLPIKIPPANRRCFDSNNGAKKSFDDQSPNLCPNQRAHTSKATSQVQGLPPPCLFHHDHVIVYI